MYDNNSQIDTIKFFLISDMVKCIFIRGKLLLSLVLYFQEVGSHQYFVPTNDGDFFFSIIGFGEEDAGQQDGATCKSCKMADLFRKKNVPQGKKKHKKESKE